MSLQFTRQYKTRYEVLQISQLRRTISYKFGDYNIARITK